MSSKERNTTDVNHGCLLLTKTKIEMEISKAQAKRNKDKFNLLTNRMTKNLMEFKNTYIGDYVMYEIHQIERKANAFKGSNMELVEKNVIGKSISAVRKESVFSSAELNCFFCEKNTQYYGYDDRITSVSIGSVIRARRKMELIELHKVEFYAEASKSYEVKCNKLIQGMMSYDWNHKMVVDDVTDAGKDFSILVYNPSVYSSEKEKLIASAEFFYHARIIYACGEIKRPHFRFITTTRKTYLS